MIEYVALAQAIAYLGTGLWSLLHIKSFMAVVDVVYTVKKVISPIYLLDAAFEAVLVLLWLIAAPQSL